MNEILKKIYERVIYHEDGAQACEKRLEEEIHTLLKPYSKRFPEEDLELIKSLMYATELKAMEEGYQLGVQYTLILQKALMSEL